LEWRTLVYATVSKLIFIASGNFFYSKLSQRSIKIQSMLQRNFFYKKTNFKYKFFNLKQTLFLNYIFLFHVFFSFYILLLDHNELNMSKKCYK
jgi:hypothetical protein